MVVIYDKVLGVEDDTNINFECTVTPSQFKGHVMIGLIM